MTILTDLFPAAPDWRHRSACRGHDPELWWADDPNHVRSQLALNICAACPVRAACRDHALDGRETEGIWGGLTASQRRALRRDRHRERKAVA